MYPGAECVSVYKYKCFMVWVGVGVHMWVCMCGCVCVCVSVRMCGYVGMLLSLPELGSISGTLSRWMVYSCCH